MGKGKWLSCDVLFFWLKTADLAKERVKTRVAEGGHNITEDVIERRYFADIKNLFEIYLPIVNEAVVYDNSDGEPTAIAKKFFENEEIFDKTKFEKIKLLSHGKD